MVDIITRAGKGAPLTNDEFDQTLINLKEAIEGLFGLTVAGWTQDDETLALTLELSDGTIVGPVQLPSQPVRFLGPWAPGSFAVGDVVELQGSSFVNTTADLVSADFETEFDAGHWKLFAAGAKLAPFMLTACRAGAISTDALLMSWTADAKLRLTSMVVTVETAPGGSNAFGIEVSLNGVAAPPVVIAGTDTSAVMAVPVDVEPGTKVVIKTVGTATAGAAADLGLTLNFQRVLSSILADEV